MPRIGFHPHVQRRPWTVLGAVEHVQSWLAQPCVRLVVPTSQPWLILQRMLHVGEATGNLVPNAYLAVEHDCVLCATDADFARFSGLKWRNRQLA